MLWDAENRRRRGLGRDEKRQRAGRVSENVLDELGSLGRN